MVALQEQGWRPLTYRVVLHPSYLQRVFSCIIFIKEIYNFMILSGNSRAPGGVPWAELKRDEHLCADCQKSTEIWCSFTYCLWFWFMTGMFYSWDRSIFQYQTMCKSSTELGLVYKIFVNKHTCKTLLLPRFYPNPVKKQTHLHLVNVNFQQLFLCELFLELTTKCS